MTLCGYDHHRSYLLLIYFLQSSCLATIIILFSYLIPAQNFVAKNRKMEATATGQVTYMILILQKTQIVTKGAVERLLVMVALIYFILIVPLVPVEFNLMGEDPAFWSLVLYSAYWWIYAVNFVIYVATMKRYRSIFMIFLRDMTQLLGVTKLASHPRLAHLPQK